MVSLGKYGQFVVTLITVPLCARMLGVEGTGLLAISTSAYFFGSIFVDWGLAQVLAGRVGRSLPAGATRRSYAALRAMFFSLVLLFFVSVLLIPSPMALHMIALGLVAGGISSLGEEWILLGRGQFARIAIFQICGRVFYLVSLVVLLPLSREPWLPIVLLGAGNLISAALSWWQVRRTSFVNDGTMSVAALVRSGRSPATARLLAAGYGQGSSVYFSLVVSVPALGLFSAADKLTRAAGSALDAFGVALLPRMSRSITAADEFWGRARRGASAAFILGSVAAAALWLTAPWAIGLLYGAEFHDAIGVLRLMVFLLPAAATSSMLSTAVLYVREDSRGILGGSLLGVTLGGVAFALTWISGGEIEVMVLCIVSIEWLLLTFNLWRVGVLRRREAVRADQEFVPSSSQPDLDTPAS